MLSNRWIFRAFPNIKVLVSILLSTHKRISQKLPRSQFHTRLLSNPSCSFSGKSLSRFHLISQIFKGIQAGALCRPVGKYNKHLLSSPHYGKIHHTVEPLSALLCCTSSIHTLPAIFMKGLSGVFLRSVTVNLLLQLSICFYDNQVNKHS